MPAHITPDEVRQKITAAQDELAADQLPEGSLARARYDRGPAYLELPHAPEEADAEECRRYGLTPEQWSEEVEAARIAYRHDTKLDLVREGAGRV
jgi:hypothetical protein